MVDMTSGSVPAQHRGLGREVRGPHLALTSGASDLVHVSFGSCALAGDLTPQP